MDNPRPMSNRTFTIIKPDSVRKGNFGKIISRLETEGFRILGIKKISLSSTMGVGVKLELSSVSAGGGGAA